MKTINFAVSEHNSRVYSLIFLGDNMKFKKYATKTLMIVIGSIISAYGITLAIGAGFGGATLAILWQGLTNVTGMSIGTSSLIVAVAMIIFALFYDRKQINIGLQAIVCKYLQDNVATGDTMELHMSDGTAVANGKTYTCTKLPEYMQGILNQGGLIASLNKEEK